MTLSTSRQACDSNISTSDLQCSFQEQSDSHYEIGWRVFCECLHQRLHREIWNWLFCWWSSLKSNWFLCLSVTHLLYMTVCLCVCLSCVENKRTVLLKDRGCCKWMRECLCSNNRYITVWLQVDVRKYKWNHLLSILREFQYSGASKVGWEAQLRGNFMYWTQQGDCKTERQGYTLEHAVFMYTRPHTQNFLGLFKYKDKHHEKQWQILAL